VGLVIAALGSRHFGQTMPVYLGSGTRQSMPSWNGDSDSPGGSPRRGPRLPGHVESIALVTNLCRRYHSGRRA
jgi:hypothetical protein